MYAGDENMASEHLKIRVLIQKSCTSEGTQKFRAPSPFKWSEYTESLGYQHEHSNPDPREDPKSRSLKAVPIKYPLVVFRVPN